MIRADGDSVGQRVVKAAKAVVRYIHARGLAEGDRLPPQQEMRKLLGFSNDTLSSAMRMLTDAGILSRKSKLGTQVADLASTIPGLWSVALLLPPAHHMLEVPFFAQLAHFLQWRILQAGHRCQVYPPAGGPTTELPPAEQFLGLTEAVAARTVDAVVTNFHTGGAAWQWAARKGIPVCYVWWWERASLGVVIDQAPMAAEAVSLLAGQGCRRLAIVSQGAPDPNQGRFWLGFTRGLRAVGRPIEHLPPLYAGEGVLAGRTIARRLLDMPAGRRPDGLVIVDDRVAMGLTAELVAAGDWRPRIAVHTNKQAPLAFALPVFRFEIDIEALATLAVDLVSRRLLDPSLPDELVYYRSHVAGPHEGEHPRP